MQDESSVERGPDRRAMLALNFLPLLHAAGALACLLTPWPWLAPAALYLAPLIPARLLRESLRASPAEIAVDSPAFIRWWACFQCQVLFLRFPVLEEVLRLIPGVYSLWLRMWGSRVGRLTYWAPGTVVLDRGFLDIGDDVVFGAGVRINPHVMEKEPDPTLLLAPVKIGTRAVVGGYSLLTAGSEIAENEATRAFLISPPFSKWKNGRRTRETS